MGEQLGLSVQEVAFYDVLAAKGEDWIDDPRLKEVAVSASGKLASRPELDNALLVAKRAGDQLVITKLDRLGRSLEHLIQLSGVLQERGVDDRTGSYSRTRQTKRLYGNNL